MATGTGTLVPTVGFGEVADSGLERETEFVVPGSEPKGTDLTLF